MSFSIDIQPICHLNRIRIKNQNTNSHIDIISKGGLLNSWVIPTPTETDTTNIDIIDGNDFSNGWVQFEANGFKGGKMNPFSCRLHKGKFENEGKVHQIHKFFLGDHALHGLLYDAEFEIESTHIQADCACLILKHDYFGEDAGFPFHYTIHIKWTYWLDEKITSQTIIQSKDDKCFPMMDGWHPYFTLGNTIDDCTIQFNNKGMLKYDDALIPTGALITNHEFENGKSLANLAQDNGYLLDPLYPACTLENNKYKLIVTPGANYPYLQLYIPANRKSIAIENLSGAPDCFNNKMGLHIMQPHTTWKLETQFQFLIK